VARLGAAGIGFTVISSRPPFGLGALVQALALRLPMGAFNGAALASPELVLLDRRTLPARTVRDAVARFRALAVDVWLFTTERWMVENADGAYVPLEIRTIATQPTVVDDLEAHLDEVS